MTMMTQEPTYRRVANEMRVWVADGLYKCGAKLPSEHTLASQFNVSRVTVRRALSELRHQGIVEGRQGSGNFVCTQRNVQNLGRLRGFKEEMDSAGTRAASQVLSISNRPANVEVAKALDLEKGSYVTEIRRLRNVNLQPTSLDVGYFSLEVGRQLQRGDVANDDIIVALENRLGYELGIADIVVNAEAADQSISEYLKVDIGAPIIVLRRLIKTTDEVPLWYEYQYKRGDLCEFHIRVPRW